jgi:hypothetical protein
MALWLLGYPDGSALHLMLFLENLIRALLIFNGLRSRHCQRALLIYHYPVLSIRPRRTRTRGHLLIVSTCSPAVWGRHGQASADMLGV